MMCGGKNLIVAWNNSGIVASLLVKMIKQLTSNISYFIVCEATCFGPYVTIISCFIILILNLNTSGCLQSNSVLVFSENLLHLAKLMFQQNSATKYC